MTWVDVTHTSTRSLGNFNRFVQAASRNDAQDAVDFFDVFSVSNPWSFTSAGPITFSAFSRNDPV
jgi:hypothetical protein